MSEEITIRAFIKNDGVMCLTMDDLSSFDPIAPVFDRFARPKHEDNFYDLLVEIVRVPNTTYEEAYYGEFKVESYTFAPNNAYYFLNHCINL